MAAIAVILPQSLAELVGIEAKQSARGETIGQVLGQLTLIHPALKDHLYDENASLRRRILCFYNDEFLPADECLDRPLGDGDCISLVRSISGG
jgi:sulfur carrier protein ThiS